MYEGRTPAQVFLRGVLSQVAADSAHPRAGVLYEFFVADLEQPGFRPLFCDHDAWHVFGEIPFHCGIYRVDAWLALAGPS